MLALIEVQGLLRPILHSQCPSFQDCGQFPRLTPFLVIFSLSYGLQRWLLMKSTTFMTSTESLEQWEGHWDYLSGSHSCNACCSSWAVSVISVRSDATYTMYTMYMLTRMCWIICRGILVVMSEIFLCLQKVWNKIFALLFSPMYRAGRPIIRKVLKIRIWGVPPVSFGSK